MNKKIITIVVVLFNVLAISAEYYFDTRKKDKCSFCSTIKKPAKKPQAFYPPVSHRQYQTNPYKSSFQSDRSYIDQTNRNMGNR